MVACYVGCENGDVLGYDLRYLKDSTPVLITAPSYRINENVEGGDGEINSIDVIGGSMVYCNDSNLISVLDLTSPAVVKPNHFKNGHEATSLTTSSVFRTASSRQPCDLVTGGTDCTLCLWDATTKNRPLDKFVITPEDTNESTAQSFNPPFIYQIHHEPCNAPASQFAAAVGDGTVRLFDVSVPKAKGSNGRSKKATRKINHVKTLSNGHSKSVSSLSYCSPSTWGSHPSTPERSLNLISSGNEGNVVIWNVFTGGIVGGVEHGKDINLVEAGWERGWVWVGGDKLTLYVFDC
jgi:WD40 repeat protein